MKLHYRISLACSTMAFLFFGLGCKTVVRENIVSSVNTGIGISLTENPQTELYEVKIGYIRSQFYSVPTGKMVEADDKVNGAEQKLSNGAHRTPNVVSGIRFNSDFRHLLLGATISENFAVGDRAVMSPAAVAMYIADAGSKEAAKSAAEGVRAAAPIAAAKIKAEMTKAQQILQHVSPSGTLDKDKLTSLARGTVYEQTIAHEINSLTSESFKKHLDEDWSFMIDDLHKNLPSQ